MKAKPANHGEKMGGVWSALGKTKKPCNPIHRLKIPNSNLVQYKRHSKGMTKLARDHHKRLQEEDINTNISQDEYTTNLEDLLRNIPESQCIPEPERSPMNWKITKAQVQKALELAKDRSATGLDSCPYKLWKKLQHRHDKRTHQNKPSFDIIKTLTYVF